jgi:hypothetical protein
MKGDRNSLTAILDLSPFSSRTTLELAMFVLMHDTADCLSLSR